MLQIIRPNQCRAIGAAFLFLFALPCPGAAEEPTLARLSFWVPPERMAEFEQIYEEQVVPILDLEKYGLLPFNRRGRATPDSVFSRLFVIDLSVKALQNLDRYWEDSTWVAAMEKGGEGLGIGVLRAHLGIYKTPVGPGKRMDAGSGTTVEAGPGRMVEAGSGFRQGIWQTFGVQDGLPSEVVLEMLQDRNGHLWFSTMGGGVCRYDGQSFTTFTTADGLAGDWVWPILEDRSGNLWFGTSNYLWERSKKSRGVSRYDGDSFVTFTTADGLANNEVWTIEEDRQGRLWFGTGGGVSRYDGDSFINIPCAHEKTAKKVSSICLPKPSTYSKGDKNLCGLRAGSVGKLDWVEFLFVCWLLFCSYSLNLQQLILHGLRGTCLARRNIRRRSIQIGRPQRLH